VKILVAEFKRQEPGVAPDGKRMEQAYYTVRFDFGLKPAA
jgi:hypothetical protein